MALSGSITNYFQGARSRFHIIVDWSASQNITNNTSTITAKVYVKPDGAINASANKSGSITIAGNKKDFTFVLGSVGAGVKKYVAEHSRTITHDTVGDLTAAISSSLAVNMTYSDKSLVTISASGDAVLNNIPRASSFTLGGSTTTGSAVTVAITRASTSFTHRVRWRIGSGAWTTSATAAGTSANVTIPHTAIPNNPSATVTIAVQTLSGTTAIGSEVSATRTLTVPTSVIPTISAVTATENVSDVATRVGAFVKGKSKLNLAITGANGAGGSTITGYKITLTGTTINTSSGVSNLVTVSGDVVITGTVTDSRGRTGSKTLTINVLDYNAPTLTDMAFYRSNSAGVADPTGTYVTVKGTVTVSSLIVGTTQKNKVSYDSQHNKSGSFVSFITESPNVITKAYTNILPTFTIDKIFNFRSRAGDIFGYGGWLVGVVPSGEVTQQWGRKTTSFGKMIDNTSYNIQAGTGGIHSEGPIIDKNGKEVLGGTVNPYPIGSIYISVSNVNPSTLFGGTWVAFATGRTLVGVDTSQTEFNTVKKTGGHKELQAHTHSVSGSTNTTGNHRHGIRIWHKDNTAGNAYVPNASASVPTIFRETMSDYTGNHSHTVTGTAASTGGGNAQNLQPYITVYMWERTA